MIGSGKQGETDAYFLINCEKPSVTRVITLRYNSKYKMHFYLFVLYGICNPL